MPCPAHKSHLINICSSINCWFSHPSSDPVLPTLTFQREPGLGKWSNVFIMLTSLGEKSSQNSWNCVVLILYFSTMVFYSTLKFFVARPQIYSLLQSCYFWYQKVGDVSIWNIVYLHSSAQNSLKCQYYVFMFLIEFHDVTSIVTSHHEVFLPPPIFGKVYYDNDKVIFMKCCQYIFPQYEKEDRVSMELSC